MELSIPFFNDIWMDNATQNFYRLLSEYEEDYDNIDLFLDEFELKIEYDENDLKKILNQIIQDNKKNLIIIEKDKNGRTKEVKKDFIIIQEGKKLDGKVAFKEKIYFNPKQESEKISSSIAEKGNKVCIFCGENYKKKYDNLKQAVYPFVTKIKSLNGVRTFKDGTYYSFKDYYDDICPKCYLLGILEWLDSGIIYRVIPMSNTFLFLPKGRNLRELDDFKDYGSILNNNMRYSNIRVNVNNQNPEEKTENTYGKFNTLLCFYGKLFSKTDTINFNNEWDIISIPWGSVKNVKLNYFNLNNDIMEIIGHFSQNESEDIYSILNKIYFFKNNPEGSPVDFDLTNKIKEELSNAFLNNNFRRFSRNFLPQKGGKIGFKKDTWNNIEKLIYLWRFENMGISEENLKSIKSVGNIIAKVSSESNLSMLYRLDKARSTKEFFGVLAEISKKLIGIDNKGEFKPTSLDELIKIINNNEKSWDEIRDLLIIYASMYYSIANKSKSNNENNGD